MSVPSILKNRIYTNLDMVSACELYACCNGEVAIYSHRSPFKETPNEDSAAVFCLSDKIGVFVVADGMGGMPSAREASAIAINSIHATLKNTRTDHSILREKILDGIEQASEKINSLGVGAGSTLAAIELNGNILRPYHVGDAIILVIGQKGKIKLQTTSHSPVGYAIQAGILDEADAIHHEERHLVSNMLGSHEMHIEIGPALSLTRYDTVILASDGLFDNLLVSEITQRIRKGSLEDIAASLIEECSKRMQYPQIGQPSKPDDVTFILYRRTK
jgi:PPM family protein phosphatase